MTQEEFKVISEIVKESKNIPNAKLEETIDKLTSEFETSKKAIIGMSFYLDKLEELYNTLLKEYKERTNG